MSAARLRRIRRRVLLLSVCLTVGLPACRPGNAQVAPAPTRQLADESTAAATIPEAPSESVPAATPHPTTTAEARPHPISVTEGDIYISQPGDTMRAIAGRFGVYYLELRCVLPGPSFCPEAEGGQDVSPDFNPDQLLPAGTALILPEIENFHAPTAWLLPDSAIVFSSNATGFNTSAYLESAGGYLQDHRQYLMMNAWNTAADVIDLVARENSINPQLLVALLEFQCGCVFTPDVFEGPFLGADFHNRHDLYGQLVWAVHELSEGYYGWRTGQITSVELRDGTTVRMNPRLNAGTAALYRLFASLNEPEGFWASLDPVHGFPGRYVEMFGNPWDEEIQIYPDGVTQPALELPFEPGTVWSFTGGPHPAFENNGPLAALDFAPASALPGCEPASSWVAAAADGLVVRSEYNLVLQDLDGDGDETTGWVLMYMHIATGTQVENGTYLQVGDRVGKPSCEGGVANGTHVHLARKLNGEWISAGSGPLPFVLSGWVAEDGPTPYKGRLHRDGEWVEACTCSWRQSWITHE